MTHSESSTHKVITRQCQHSKCSCVAKLMRKLKKQSINKMLCITTTRPAAAFDCHYDPLSYARNFDQNGCGGNDDVFYGSFSARFVAAAKQPLVQSNVTR